MENPCNWDIIRIFRDIVGIYIGYMVCFGLVWLGLVWWKAPIGETGPALPPRPGQWGSSRPSRTNAAKTQREEKRTKNNRRAEQHVKRHEQHCEAPCQRRKKQETEKEDIEVPQRGQGGLVESNQAQRRLANKKEEETGRAHRTRGQRGPRQTQTAKNLSKKDSEGIYGKAIGPEKGTTIIRAHTVGRKCIAIYSLAAEAQPHTYLDSFSEAGEKMAKDST